MWAACCLRSLCSLPSLQCKLVYKTDSGGGLAGFATQNWVSRALPATGSRGVKNGRTMNLPPRQPLQSLPQLNSTFDKRVYAFIYRCPAYFIYSFAKICYNAIIWKNKSVVILQGRLDLCWRQREVRLDWGIFGGFRILRQRMVAVFFALLCNFSFYIWICTFNV